MAKQIGRYCIYRSITGEELAVTYVTEKVCRKGNLHNDLVYVGIVTDFIRNQDEYVCRNTQNIKYEKEFISEARDYFQEKLAIDKVNDWNSWAKKLKF